MGAMTETVEQLLASRPEPVADLTRRLIALIEEVYPDAVVTVDGGDIGFGSGTGYKGLVFVVSPHAKHVTLGLAGGASLPDPARLMEGAGRVHRHIKLREDSDLVRPGLRDLMTAAVGRARPADHETADRETAG
jgi:hypothetical protein